MTIADVPQGMRLKELAGWNQTEADLRRFLKLQPDGCFVAEVAGQVVGTVTAFIFGNVAWIAMVLVDPQYRKHGIGTALMTQALAVTGQRTVRLDATALGQPVYAKLGFVGEYELTRYVGMLTGSNGSATTPASLETVTQLDFQVTATPRASLLETLAAEAGAHVRLVGTSGYLMDRPGSNAKDLGQFWSRKRIGIWNCGDFQTTPIAHRIAAGCGCTGGVLWHLANQSMHHISTT